MSQGHVDDREIEAFTRAYPEVVEALRDGVDADHAARARVIDAVAHRLVDEATLDTRVPAEFYGRRKERRILVRYLFTAMAASAMALIAGYVSFLGVGYIGSDQDANVLSANNSAIESDASARTGSMTQDENGATYVFFEAVEKGQGTKHRPYQTLEQAINSAESGGVIKIKGGSTSELLRIAQPVRLMAVDGPVRIGRS